MPSNSKQSFSVSVVIPAYNAAGCVGRAIDSVLAQTYPVSEIIVVNDGSTDDTEQVVKQYGSKVVYISQENSGPSVARNSAVTAAQGNWVAFVDADDEWLPEKNQRQIELLSRDPDLRWCSANYNRTYDERTAPTFNGRLIRKGLGERESFDSYFLAAVRWKCRADTPTTMVRRDVFDEIGLFDPARKRGQDLDVWWRIAHRYPKIGYIAEPLALVHLDVHDPLLTKRRLEAKRGKNARSLIAQHLELSASVGSTKDFKTFASDYLGKILLMTLFHGFKEDARETVDQFSDLLAWHTRAGTNILTVFPEFTSVTAKSIMRLAEILRLEKEVTRRGKYPTLPATRGDEPR